MAIVLSENQAVMHARRYNARHLDTVGTNAAVFIPGFRPRYVCIENLTDSIKYEWYEGMAATDYVKTIAAGTRSLGTDSALAVVATVTAATPQATITLAAAQIPANKQFNVLAMS